MLLIPSMDLRGGQCVRLLRGDFAAETRYDLDPLSLVRHYQTLGAPWLHVVDLDGARDGALAHQSLIATLAAEPGISLQVGGGIRSSMVAEQLLDSGVARLVIGSAAVESPAQVFEWLQRFGAERCCLALDVRLDDLDTPWVQIRGWTRGTELTLWQALAPYVEVGIRHVLCTDVARDGALAGPSLALYGEAMRRFPQVHWQASGGIRDERDLQALAELGLMAAISGKALLENRFDPVRLVPWFLETPH